MNTEQENIRSQEFPEQLITNTEQENRRMSRQRSGAGATEPRVATSIVHPARKCEACILCKKGNRSKYSHPVSWKNPPLLLKLQQYEPTLNIQPDSCVCQQCRRDVNLIDSTNTFVPRWKRQLQISSCSVVGCNNRDTKLTKYMGGMVDVFKLKPDPCEEIPFCSSHYMKWYKHNHTSHTRCKICCHYIEQYSKSRPVPEPEVLEPFLKENTEFRGTLSSDDRVCLMCYRSYLITIKHIKQTVCSTDAELQSLISNMKHSLPAKDKVHTIKDATDFAVRSVALTVGEALLNQTAMLLPRVYAMFKEQLLALVETLDLTISEDLPTHQWLRSQLSALLEHHMAYKCSNLRHGTILYRFGGDIFQALSTSLWQEQKDNANGSNTQEACLLLNNKLHNQAKKLIQQDSFRPHRIEDFDADSFISSIDKDVWEAICTLTQTVKASTPIHTRKIRRIFIVCVILFTINRQCSFPLHTLITDTVETCGGSSRLQTLLNRLGACASIETHSRYIQYRVEDRIKEGLTSELFANSFMIVSADNLDFIHKHGRSYCGRLEASWHGTTVQIVQPKPKTLVDSPCTNPLGSTTQLLCDRSEAIASKRAYSMLSPNKDSFLQSPCPKIARRRRTGTESKQNSSPPLVARPPCAAVQLHTQNRQGQLSTSDFLLQKEEEDAYDKLKKLSETYILLKLACDKHQKCLINLPMFFNLTHNLPSPEPSNILYFKVLDQKCDDKETLLSLINDLYSEFIVTGKKTYVILEGDQATYERIQSIKGEYRDDSTWLIPFVGDWHFLKNYQEVLLKIYFDGGLCDLAIASKYQAKSIGTNFTRTHHFLLEVWEALFRILMNFYISKEAPTTFLSDISFMVENSPDCEFQDSVHRNLKEMLEEIDSKARSMPTFSAFTDTSAKQNHTLQFWCQFLFKDCLAYIALFLGIRSGNWDLRVAALKLMVPLFTSFDRPKYTKLIPHHLLEMLTLPTPVLAHLKAGGFTVSILGRPCHSVGIDEAHEMCINKECKLYITRPSGEYMSRMATFLPIRAKAIKALEQQIYVDRKPASKEMITGLYTTDSECIKHEANVKAQVDKLQSHSSSFPSQSPSHILQHLFSAKSITPQQSHDLMNFRQLGQTEYERNVDFYILRTPSVKPPKHHKSLLTFTEKRTRQKKSSQVEKERKIQLECWKKRISFAVTTGIKDNMQYQQCIELPRAIATIDGNLVKGTKSSITKFYERRYQAVSPPIVSASMPDGWMPDSVIMEGMFLINITPWSSHKTMGDYGDFLLKQHITPHYRNTTTREVHLLFDDPDCTQCSPKYFERLNRDQVNPVASDHCCSSFSSDMIIPPKWRENVINCRKCKRHLVLFLSQHFLQKVKSRLKPGQRFITAGGFEGALCNKALAVTPNSQPYTDGTLHSNAEESDTRIWLHVLQSAGVRKLVLSPDTDVYHIGLPVVAHTNLEVIVRLSPFSSLELRQLNMQALVSAFENDPDLAGVEKSDIPVIFQMLFICTGCDFISFFNGLGKATFLTTILEYGEFITSNSTNAPGTLATNNPDSDGIFSFIRLVGCAYYKKHKTAFLPTFPTPMALYNSIPQDITWHARHTEWLNLLRDRIWTHIQYEQDMIPSYDALTKHWKRSCWVSHVWQQATANVIIYPPLENFGWKQPDPNTLKIDWDSENHLTQVRERVALIRKGCSCRTGCSTARCKCRKNQSKCGPGCKCLGCTNLPTVESTIDVESDSDISSSTISDDESNLRDEVDQLMLDVFGNGDIEDSDCP